MANKWQDFQRNKDVYPNLKYTTIGDARVRDKHKEWDGFVAPIDHPIWKKLLPPNEWGCRCDVIQTDESPTKGYENFTPEIKNGFANNPAISGEVFSDTLYTNGLDLKNIIKTTQNGLLWLHKNAKTTAHKHYVEKAIYQLPRKWQFKEIYSTKNGKTLKHILASENAEDYREVLQTANLFANEGKTVEILPVIRSKELMKYKSKIFKNYNHTAFPDLRIGVNYLDLKRVSAVKNILRNANKASDKQKSVAIIYLLDGVEISEEVLKNRVLDIFKSKFYTFNEVYFIIKGKLIKFNRR